jgi:hypothetical protein
MMKVQEISKAIADKQKMIRVSGSSTQADVRNLASAAGIRQEISSMQKDLRELEPLLGNKGAMKDKRAQLDAARAHAMKLHSPGVEEHEQAKIVEEQIKILTSELELLNVAEYGDPSAKGKQTKLILQVDDAGNITPGSAREYSMNKGETTQAPKGWVYASEHDIANKEEADRLDTFNKAASKFANKFTPTGMPIYDPEQQQLAVATVQMLKEYRGLDRYKNLSDEDLAAQSQMLLGDAFKDYFDEGYKIVYDDTIDEDEKDFKIAKLEEVTKSVLGFVPNVDGKAWALLKELTNTELNDLKKYQTEDEKESGIMNWLNEVGNNLQ